MSAIAGPGACSSEGVRLRARLRARLRVRVGGSGRGGEAEGCAHLARGARALERERHEVGVVHLRANLHRSELG